MVDSEPGGARTIQAAAGALPARLPCTQAPLSRPGTKEKGVYSYSHIFGFGVPINHLHPSLEEGKVKGNPGADLHTAHTAPFLHPYTHKSIATLPGVTPYSPASR